MKYKILHHNYTKTKDKSLKSLKFQGFVFKNGTDGGLKLDICGLIKY